MVTDDIYFMYIYILYLVFTNVSICIFKNFVDGKADFLLDPAE